MSRQLYTYSNRAFPVDNSRGFPVIGGGIGPAGPPVDPDFSSVVLLLHADGADEATSTSDNSDSGHTINFIGNAQLDTAQKKFGASSVLLDGNGDLLSIPDSTDWDFGSGNFTVEGFFRWNVDSAAQMLFGQWNTSTNQRTFTVDHVKSGNLIRLLTSTTGGNFFIDISAPFTVTLATWYHVVLDFDGTTYRLYVNGVVVGSTTTVRTWHVGSAVFGIGERPNLVSPLNGWVDEFRITKGVARYAGAFTPPTEAFPDSS